MIEGVEDFFLMNILYFIRLLRYVNPWKTLYVNFHYFPFRTAIKTPVFICWRTKLITCGGEVILPSKIWRGMISFGIYDLGIQDSFYSRTLWELSGRLIVKGSVHIGRGSGISVAKGATLILGENFVITGRSHIVCQKMIQFGNGVLLSWDILIMDTDFHKIIPIDNNEQVNLPSAICIGSHIWIGCRSTILKGVTIADNSIISAGSIITRSIDEENCVVGGQGKTASVLRRNVSWKA